MWAFLAKNNLKFAIKHMVWYLVRFRLTSLSNVRLDNTISYVQLPLTLPCINDVRLKILSCTYDFVILSCTNDVRFRNTISYVRLMLYVYDLESRTYD